MDSKVYTLLTVTCHLGGLHVWPLHIIHFQKEAPLFLGWWRSKGDARHFTQYTFRFGFSEIHCKTNWNANLLCKQISKAFDKISSKTKPGLTWNPPSCTSTIELFCHHFLRIVCGGCFMASVLAESVGWALQPNQTEAETNLGHRRANPAPPPRLLGSSRLSQKYSLQKQRNMVYKIMEIQWQYLKNTLSSSNAGPWPPLPMTLLQLSLTKT